jgi:hypothetical protein
MKLTRDSEVESWYVAGWRTDDRDFFVTKSEIDFIHVTRRRQLMTYIAATKSTQHLFSVYGHV